MIINEKREFVYTAWIKKIIPIEGYNRVELAKINGWSVVVRKGVFKEGDLCVFFEIKSKVPESDKRFSFLKKYNFEVKTRKICGVYSQGLAMPISLFPEVEYLISGLPLTKRLNVIPIGYFKENQPYSKNIFQKKFLNYLYNKGILKNKKIFPYELVNKTKIEKIENINTERINSIYYATEKLEGISATYILKKKKFGYEFIICDKDKRLLKINKNTEKYFYIANRLHLKEKLKCYFFLSHAEKYVGVQGEIIGEGIRGNPLNIKGQKFYAFNIIKDYEEFSPYSDFFVEGLKIPKVPLIGKIYTNKTIDDILFYFKKNNFSILKKEEIAEWKKNAEINSSINPNKKVYGIVFRSHISKNIKEENRFIYSFENINSSYLNK